MEGLSSLVGRFYGFFSDSFQVKSAFSPIKMRMNDIPFLGYLSCYGDPRYFLVDFE